MTVGRSCRMTEAEPIATSGVRQAKTAVRLLPMLRMLPFQRM